MTLRRASFVTAALFWVVIGVAPAHAKEVTADQLRALASRALDDPSALAELRMVDEVDGRRVPMTQILAGDRNEIEARLRALARSAPATVSDPGEARAQARRVLGQERFQPERVPRPLRGVLTWLGDNVVQPIGDRLASIFEGLAGTLPGGRPVAWLILATLVGVVAWAVARRWSRARMEGARASARAEGAESFDPSRLERDADAAELRGDLELAVRLRFRAGLLRLDERDVIVFRPSLTSYEVARVVRSPAFDALARTFDEIVYGRRPPRLEDITSSKENWSRTLERA